MTANPARSSARNLTTLLSFSQCARIVCLAIAFWGKCLGVAFIQKPSHSNPHNPVLNLKLLRTSALEIRTLHHPLLQGHSLWLSLGGWPTWEIISHLLQPRWCYYNFRPLVRTQTESPAKWLKAVSQMRAKLDPRLPERWQPYYASQNLAGIFVWKCFFCKYLGVAFIQKPSHSNPHNPVLNLKLLRTSALEIRTLHCWWLLSSQNHSVYSKSTHFDSALAADLHEKSLGIFSSHAGANAGAGHLWEHKPNLKQDELKQYLKWLPILPDHLQEIWQPC